MIRSPKIGQPVQLWYAAPKRPFAPYHGRTGTIIVVSRGPGPRNHGVEVDGAMVVTPSGNLRRPQ